MKAFDLMSIMYQHGTAVSDMSRKYNEMTLVFQLLLVYDFQRTCCGGWKAQLYCYFVVSRHLLIFTPITPIISAKFQHNFGVVSLPFAWLESMPLVVRPRSIIYLDREWFHNGNGNLMNILLAFIITLLIKSCHNIQILIELCCHDMCSKL